MSLNQKINIYIKNNLIVFKSKNKYITNELKDDPDINSE
jgi:hypothetical protein